MIPNAQLIDELFAEKVRAARQRSLEEKFLAGGNLFEAAIERMKAGILIRNPAATEYQIREEIRRRLAISRLMETASES
jgi:hypothetical protein